MDIFEVTTHAFIVRIWLEEIDQVNGRLIWRGRITHVSDGNEQYVHQLDEITDFIRQYLPQPGKVEET